jgi:hypothetical protein
MKMRIGYILILASSLLCSTSAECSEWKYLNSSSWNNHFFDVYEEPFDITNIKIVRQKTVYNEITVQRVKEAHGYRYRDFTESVHIFAINCNEKLGQIKAVYYYDSDGNIIDSKIYKNAVIWEDMQPVSSFYKLFKKVCTVNTEQTP